MAKKKQGLGAMTWLLLALLVATPFLIFFSDWGKAQRKKIAAKFAGGGKASAELKFDGKSDAGRQEFEQFAKAIGAEASIRLTIESFTDEYSIDPKEGAPGSGLATFVVRPVRYQQFLKDDIEKLVREGLRCKDPSGTRDLVTPLYASWSITTNKSDRNWSVQLEGVHPAGLIVLQIGEASAQIRTELPRIFEIWKLPISLDRRSGVFEIRGNRFYAKNHAPKGLEDRTYIRPDFTKNLSGFKIHCVTSQCVWLEVVYSEPSRDEGLLDRTRWPDLRVDWKVLDNGQSYSVVHFEGGYEAKVGERIWFGEIGVSDSLLLDREGFLSPHAVRFRYRNDRDEPVADLLCISPGR